MVRKSVPDFQIASKSFICNKIYHSSESMFLNGKSNNNIGSYSVVLCVAYCIIELHERRNPHSHALSKIFLTCNLLKLKKKKEKRKTVKCVDL